MRQYKIARYGSTCHVLEFDPKVYRFDVTVGKLHKLEKLSKINGEPQDDEEVLAKMNGAFFSMDGSTEYIGTYVDEGGYYSPSLNMYPVAVFWKDYRLTVEENPSLARHVDYQKDAFFAIGCPWLLLKDGEHNFLYSKNELIKTFSHPYTRQPRTMFGQKANGEIVWVVVDGRSKTSKGITITQQAELMKSLGCVIAFNADGGGSSEMIYKGKIVNNISDGAERSIGTAFMCYGKVLSTKKENEKPASKEETTNNDSAKKYNGVIVKCNKVNVRDKASTSGKVLGSLKSGTRLEIIGIAPNWVQIKYNNKPSAWIYDYYIKWI